MISDSKKRHGRPVIIGIIVDVSNSMRKSWKNREGEELPRIERVRDAFNDEFKRFSLLHAKNKAWNKTMIFCLGMGFKRTMHWGELNLSYDKEIPVRSAEQTKVDTSVVCDLLALSEIMPTIAEIRDLERAIDQRWGKYAKSMVEGITIDPGVDQKLLDYLQSRLNQTAINNLHASLIYRATTWLGKSQYKNRSKWLLAVHKRGDQAIQSFLHLIETVSDVAGKKYLSAVLDGSTQVFKSQKGNYEKFIQVALKEFVAEQTDRLMRLLTLGHNPIQLLETFDETQVEVLARKIYNHLHEDVEQRLSGVWLKSQKYLWLERRKIKAQLSRNQTRELTEDCIKKYIWDELQPFIRDTVFGVFRDSFKQAAHSHIPGWIGLASSREVKRSIKDIIRLFPDAIDQENFYTEEFLFGSTPIDTAIQQASLRLMDPDFCKCDQYLLIISDGEFQDASPVEACKLLKQKGVIIICLYVHEQNLISELPSSLGMKWPEGARTMFEIASNIDNRDGLYNALIKQGCQVGPENKLFLQINESENLKAFLSAFLES